LHVPENQITVRAVQSAGRRLSTLVGWQLDYTIFIADSQQAVKLMSAVDAMVADTTTLQSDFVTAAMSAGLSKADIDVSGLRACDVLTPSDSSDDGRLGRVGRAPSLSSTASATKPIISKNGTTIQDTGMPSPSVAPSLDPTTVTSNRDAVLTGASLAGNGINDASRTNASTQVPGGSSVVVGESADANAGGSTIFLLGVLACVGPILGALSLMYVRFKIRRAKGHKAAEGSPDGSFLHSSLCVDVDAGNIMEDEPHSLSTNVLFDADDETGVEG
jgi:hypothetical protein